MSIAAARHLEADQATVEKNHKQALERATYHSDLARRRYEEVDPSNRLVAAELAADIPSLWHSVDTLLIDKQHIIRELVEEVTVEVINTIERVRVTIRWTGGYESHHEIVRAVGKFDQLEFADNIRHRIVQMKRRGHTHQGVAEDLNALGYQSAQKSKFTKAIVRSLCRQFEAAGESCQAIGGYEDYWPLKLLGTRLSIPTSTLRNWLDRGWLCSVRSGERWVVWADEKELSRLTRLAEHQQGPSCRSVPPGLTTPGKPT